MGLKRKIKRIVYNYHVESGYSLSCFTHEVGKMDVVKIVEPKFDDGKQCCLVYLEDGTMSKVYNVSEIFYEAE